MNVLITGAGGYIGAHLAKALLARGELGGHPLRAVMLADRSLAPHRDPRVRTLEADLLDPATLAAIAEFAPQCTFHLAAIPGGASEADYVAGRRINLQGTLALFETLADLPREAGAPAPVVVYSSTIAVYGTTLPPLVRPDMPLHPPVTYGAHKLACEILLADFSRRGRLDGRAVRLPGIVARPRSGPGLASGFMSDIIRALAAGQPYTCPVRPQATAWWMSATRCAENLLHAATMDLAGADAARAWPLPVLRLSVAEVVQAAAELYGADRAALVQYAPDPAIEAVYGSYPVLDDAPSRSLGLRDDGDAQAMLGRALDEA